MKYNDITIILLLYHTPKKLIQNIKNYTDFKLIILDQSNDFNTKKILLNKYKNIIYYKLSNKNLGFAKAQNFLINRVKTKYFFSTQPDILIQNKNILKLRELLKKNKKTLIAVPNINKTFKIAKKKNIKIRKMIGAAFMSKTSNFKKFRMFDENFFFYWEDIDLNERINKSKFSIMTDTTCKAYHLSGKSTKNNFKSRYIRGVNFRFGEYFYLYKYNKLRILKLSREIFLNILRLILNLTFLKLNNAEKNLLNLIGILKFIAFIIKN